MFKSIVSRIVLLCAGMATVSALLVGYFQVRNGVTFRQEQQKTQAEQVILRAEEGLSLYFEMAARTPLILRDTPPVQGIVRARANGGIDPFDGSTETLWRNRLESIFQAVARNNHDISQVRYIGVADDGLELVRVDRTGFGIRVIPQGELQHKGGRGYFEATVIAADGEAVFSEINLNRENGEISMPITPTVRVSTPVFDADGKIFGLIIVNYRMSQILGSLNQYLPDWVKFYLTNADGDFLVHPDPSQTFGFDLGAPHKIQTEIPEVAAMVGAAGAASGRFEVKPAGGEHIVSVRRVAFDPRNPGRDLRLVLDRPILNIDSVGWQQIGRVALVTCALAVIGIILALVSARVVVQPLRRITRAARKVSEGEDIFALDLPTGRADEVGTLARALDAMGKTLERRQDELALREATNRAIVETALSPIITIDKHGVIESANAATTAVFGYSHDQLVGHNVSMLMGSEHALHHDQYLRNYRQTGDAKIIGVGREVDAQRSDGTRVPIHLSVSEVKLPNRQVYTGIITDLTERKKIDRMKNEFVSTVSHELRTPLTAIKGSLGLLTGSDESLSETAQKMLGIAYSNCDRLVRLINDILDIEKIEAGKLNFNFQKTDLAPFLDRTIESNVGYVEGLGVSLEREGMEPGLQIEIDGDRMNQAITNLISNAAKFSPEGATVTLRAATIDGMVRIEVEDRGSGIPEEFRAKVFAKFAQGDSSDIRQHGGTGLGLAITRTIVEAHGGRVGFESEVGVGTVFYIELPSIVSQDHGANESGSSARGKILICEDDPDTAMLLSLIVERVGYQAELCGDAATAHEMLRSGDYAAMTLDISLPDRDGRSLIRELHEDSEIPQVPIIVISAQAAPEEAEQAISAFEIIDWLEKPIKIERLQECLAHAARASGGRKKSILFVEDDADHSAIVASLIGGDVTIDAAATCAEARTLLAARSYDLVILDMFLPDGPGDSLLPAIKRNSQHPPQVLVYSILEVDDQVNAQVDAALVKSQTSNEHLKREVENLLDERKTRHSRAR